MKMTNRLALSVSALAFASIPTFALAQSANEDTESRGGLGEIVVTAQKREQSLQDVPVAITALGGEALAANRIASVRDLDGGVPNLTIRTIVGGASLPTYSMRGVVSLGAALGTDRGVALYVDGVYMGNGSGSIFEMGEIERIEVLRGPQGTLFGRNSTGGAVSVITPEPKGELAVKQTFTLGNYDQFRSITHVDTPRFGPLSLSATYLHSERRGDIRNLGGGTQWTFSGASGSETRTSPNSLGGSNTDAINAAAKLDFDKVLLVYRFDWTDTTQTSAGQGIVYAAPAYQLIFGNQPYPTLLTPITNKRPDAVNNWAALPSRVKNEGHSLTASAEISDQLSIKNIAAYRTSSYATLFSQIDGAGGLRNTPSTGGVGLPGTADVLYGFACLPAGVAPQFCPYYQPSAVNAPLMIQTVIAYGTYKQFSNEFQVNYDSDFLTLTAGALYFHQKQTQDLNNTYALKSAPFAVFPGFNVPNLGQPNAYGAVPSFVKVNSKAIYGQAEVHVTPQLDLILGGRYTHDRKRGEDRATANALNPTGFYPIDYKDGQFTYNVGVNFKPTDDILLYAKYATGFISGGLFASIPFDSEKAKSFEAGIKADLLDNRLRFNLAAFSAKYDSMQFTTTGRNIGRPELTQVVLNAGDAKAQGFELETTLAPVDGLVLGGSLGYTDFKYRSLSPIVTAGAYDYLVHERPKWTGNVNATYTAAMDNGSALVARIDGSYRSAANGTSFVPGTAFGFSQADSEAFKAAQRIGSYWLWNVRLAAQDVELAGVKSTFALWGRNIFNNKSVSYSPSLVFLISADYQRAATFGADWTFEF
ncbi:MAG: TonB-dependent receptor [Novosphingobium sp.]|nr:TonB-dependent receptor [Novosphingobium sp.]